MSRAKRPLLALIIACLSLAGTGLVIWQIPPANLWVEIGAVLLLTIGLGLIAGWLMGRKKTAFITLSFILVTLLMNRFGILNWITLGLWVAVLGLISLIN